MKRSEPLAQPTPPVKPFRTPTAGLYGEIPVLPVSRAAPAPLQEPRPFL